MARLRLLVFTILVIYFSNLGLCKIVLPNKLRYLENMLNAEVVAKAAKIRQRMEANPNIPDSDKGWPTVLGKYQSGSKGGPFPNMYNSRPATFKQLLQ